MIKVGKYTYEKSTRKDKKLMTKINNKTIHFGDAKMEHYKDRTGIWKDKDHNDKTRRASFRKRTEGIKKKDGTPAYLDPNQPAWHSYHILW